MDKQAKNKSITKNNTSLGKRKKLEPEGNGSNDLDTLVKDEPKKKIQKVIQTR